MKYKVGDKVKIREDLEVDKIYDSWDCSDDMVQYGGRIATIVKCHDDSYQIDVDDKFYNWTDGMFEDIKEDIDTEKTVDIGYYLEYCGYRVIKNVYYGGYAHDHDHVFCTTADSKNQYTFPVNSIDFIVPHED